MGKCDTILAQYSRLTREAAVSEAFTNFNVDVHRLDKLLYGVLAKDKTQQELWSVVRIVLLLSHGQASVERGFSVNKETMSENMAEHTLVAKRVVKDYLLSMGGKVADLKLTPALLSAAVSGRQRYQQFLDEEKRKTVREQGRQKRKADMNELDTMQAEKKRLENSIKALQDSTDQYAEDAERTGKVAMVAQSNSHHCSAKTKAEELQELQKSIAEKQQQLQSA